MRYATPPQAREGTIHSEHASEPGSYSVVYADGSSELIAGADVERMRLAPQAPAQPASKASK